MKKCLRVVYAACDVTNVDACEGVDGSGVTADLDDVGVFCCEDGYVALCRNIWLVGIIVGREVQLTAAATAPYGFEVGRRYQFSGILSVPGV